ncbi:hypothetical protein DLH72_05210 [Candidatus Gracilibacteria bacterium]|nr:MAG: hypothetical protein DLH72_05210 [Candidatus Gracilibacteria bacterium]
MNFKEDLKREFGINFYENQGDENYELLDRNHSSIGFSGIKLSKIKRFSKKQIIIFLFNFCDNFILDSLGLSEEEFEKEYGYLLQGKSQEEFTQEFEKNFIDKFLQEKFSSERNMFACIVFFLLENLRKFLLEKEISYEIEKIFFEKLYLFIDNIFLKDILDLVSDSENILASISGPFEQKGKLTNKGKIRKK